MATERLDGYDQLVGRWSEPQHRAALRDGRHAYFVAPPRRRARRFTIIRDWASPERVTAIKRIAVAQPGRGRPAPTGSGSASFPTTTVPAAPMRPSASRPKGWRAAVRSSADVTATSS